MGSVEERKNSKVNLPYLSFAIQLQQYHMSSINYISLGNTNTNIIRCKLQFFFSFF